MCLPYFPTQNQEAEIGSDVVIGIRNGDLLLEPLFLQYKRSEKLVRSTANEWAEFQKPYYRFEVHSRNQHNTLVRLGHTVGTAVYVAPGFHTTAEYESHHKNRRLATNSVCFDCGEMNSINHNDHCIVDTFNPLRGAFCSDSEEITPTEGIRMLLMNMRDNGENFRMYDALRGRFAEVRSELIQDSNPDDEYGEQEELQNPVTWMRTQQQFFFGSFGIVLLFVLEPDGIVNGLRTGLFGLLST